MKRIANVKQKSELDAGMIPTRDAILRRSGLITANNASLLQVATALVSPVDYEVCDSSYRISKYNTVLLESCVQFCCCCTRYIKFKRGCTFIYSQDAVNPRATFIWNGCVFALTSTTPYQKGVVHAAARLFLNSYSRLVKAAFAVQEKS